MSLDADVAILRELPLFAAFTDDQLRLVAFSAEPIQIMPGAVLFEEGAPAVSGFLLVTGRIGLSVKGEDGPIDKGTVGPGTLLGELALVCHTVRPVTAEALESCSLRSIPRRAVRRVLTEYPDVAIAMRHHLAERLQLMTGEFEQARHALLALDEPR